MKLSTEYNGVCGVYYIECLINNRKYVGQSRNLYRRCREHTSDLRRGVHRNKSLQSDFSKYGEENFRIVVFSDIENLDEYEQKMISDFGGVDSNGCYNVFSGGRCSYQVSMKFKERASEIQRGKVVSDETKEKMSDNARRQWLDEEYRSTMKESAKRQWEDPEYRKIMKNVHTGNPYACGHKLTIENVRAARDAYSQGNSISNLASQYGVKYSTMRSAVLGISWKNI